MTDVAIIGGGPVGLLTGLLLLQRGRSVRIFERRTARSRLSRAIGIHPPALKVLDRAGIAPPLLGEGIRIAKGVAYSRGHRVAELAFDGDPSFPFVLAVPQPVTEEALERAVLALDPSAIVRGVVVDDVEDDGTVTLAGNSASGRTSCTARLVVAADGAHSLLRERLVPGLCPRHYPDSYLMGDFEDTTTHPKDAVLYLEPGGIVESFPLPGGVRRWVVRLGSPALSPTAAGLAALVRARTGQKPHASTNTMLSAFEVQSRLAKRMVHGRVILLGDAAHEISPIGGQGMNLGWLDAAALVPIIDASLAGDHVGRQLQEFERSRRRAAAKASNQAGLNMALGRPLPPTAMTFRNALFGCLLQSRVVSDLVERRFTMR
ncbi:NAD(P)/FAD-dependent oxidoreductase [Paenarthrobacter sp. S56]|uniref:FAD-dependent oxidoreductase n=1 Tax=Paenarthrobacter sp. S56 TaxID=3138179 RepID=UPI00321AE2D2